MLLLQTQGSLEKADVMFDLLIGKSKVASAFFDLHFVTNLLHFVTSSVEERKNW